MKVSMDHLEAVIQAVHDVSMRFERIAKTSVVRGYCWSAFRSKTPTLLHRDYVFFNGAELGETTVLQYSATFGTVWQLLHRVKYEVVFPDLERVHIRGDMATGKKKIRSGHITYHRYGETLDIKSISINDHDVFKLIMETITDRCDLCIAKTDVGVRLSVRFASEQDAVMFKMKAPWNG